ncbi:serine/threonine-protein kinase [Embleya scabrispora]|uniref:serine/threonine-protein kinase n=1 Tax=Embleya scabrispora TaxID=159449 RepID=UPI00039E101F|nr:serine/threonine-protein kinase [Embleya scabrispora]MYS79199.1 protein kinase [Streptomyces sp. SID5474]
MYGGTIIGGRYRVEHVLGRGGLGEVWEALDLTLDRRVAVKFVTGVMQYPEAATRFAREARTLASLHHAGIVTVHDAGTIDHDGGPLPYLVLEKLHGSTWETAQVDSVVETGARLADALAHVHEARILHRDIKPANIMICPDGRVVLMDFGIARDDASLTRTVTAPGRAFGTPAYMAPEQLQGHPATPSSDVYSLGLVLVEKLTGHRLPAEQLTAQVQAVVPGHLLPLLTRMTSPRPDQRPTAAECAELLRTPVEPARSRGPVRHDALGRFLPPAVLLTLFAISLFLPAYTFSGTGEAWIDDQDGQWTVKEAFGGGGLVKIGAFVGLATTLVTTVVLVPGSGVRTRLAGYAGAALAVGCLLWLGSSNPPYYDLDDEEQKAIRSGMWLFYLTTAAGVATYIHRDVRTRSGTALPRERLAAPAMLLTLFAITLFQPAYLDSKGYWSVMEAVAGDGLTSVGVFAGLATTLVATAVLVPGSGVRTRLAGYAGAALAAGCLLRLHAAPDADLDADPTYLALRLFHLTSALTIATFIHRDTTRSFR